MRLTPCHRCKGAGFFPEFRHVSNGVCFRCNGSRYEELFNNHGSFTIERSLSPSADSYDLIKSSYKEDKKEWYFKMGRNYHLGLNGYERNIRKAYDHYYKAAIQGYGKAQKLLGDIYKFGNEEIDVNYGKARRWYMYAAMQGRYEAYLSLVDLFKKGLGVEKSNHIAQEWKSTYENKEESLDIEWIAPEMNLSAFVTLHGPCKPKQRIDRFSGLTVHSIDAYDGTSADFSKELEAELLSNKTEGKKFQLDINKLFIMEFRIKSTKKSGFLAYYSDKSYSLFENDSKRFSVKYLGKETFTDTHGVVYSIDKTHLIEFPLSLKITEYTVLDSCQFIDDCAFKADVDPGDCIDDLNYYGNQLITIILPDGLKVIGNSAFLGCRKIESIKIPASVESIGLSAFTGCEKLKSVVVDENNQIYDSRGHCNAIIRTEDNTLIYGCRNSHIPDTVLTIGKLAFAECKGLTEIELPSSIEAIEDSAFDLCKELRSINLPASLGYVGKNAFFHCISLKEVYINSFLDSINYKTFEDCWNLNSIYIHKEQYEFYRELFSFTPLIQFVQQII